MLIRQKTILLLTITMLFFSGCGVTRHVTELLEPAENAFLSGNYKEALLLYEELIGYIGGRDHEIKGKAYYRAGISAWNTDDTNKAIEYLVQAERDEYTGKSGYHILALAYREIDNLSLEITYLEKYLEHYPRGEHAGEMKKSLFLTYLESNNHDTAMELWQDIEGMAENDPDLLEGYFYLSKSTGKEDVLKETAEKLLRVDNGNITALEYLGDHYFWLAENRHREEMKAYEENQTRAQYRQLLNALDIINEQFRLSRDYFEQLMDIKPVSAYAEYLKNIYLRFGNDEKAEFYHQRSLEL